MSAPHPSADLREAAPSSSCEPSRGRNATADGQAKRITTGEATVGLIGIGAIGSGFAWNLIRAGLTVRGFDLDPERLELFTAWGGRATRTPAEAAAGARWIVTALPDQADVRDAALGTHGIVAGAAPGALLIDTTTSSPDASRSLAAELATRQHGFVDASVSGTGATAMTGDIVLLVGGAPADVADCQAVFDVIARRTYHLGPVGSGALAKLAVNVAVVGSRLALAEALSFGRVAGMDQETLLSVLKDGPAYSRAMDIRGEKMVRRDYHPDSTLAASLHSADVLLAEGHRLGAPLLLASLYAQIARVAASHGFADRDPAAVIEALLLMSGSPDSGSETA